jgi:hypothetical protein
MYLTIRTYSAKQNKLDNKEMKVQKKVLPNFFQNLYDHTVSY